MVQLVALTKTIYCTGYDIHRLMIIKKRPTMKGVGIGINEREMFGRILDTKRSERQVWGLGSRREVVSLII